MMMRRPLRQLQPPPQSETSAEASGVRRVNVPGLQAPAEPEIAKIPFGDPRVIGNDQGPRELQDTSGPTRINQPGGMPGGTPSRPSFPTPVSSQAPQPFRPMQAPRGIAGSAMSPSSGLLGRAGGLLGGGLGVPGVMKGGQDISALIQQLLARMGR